MPEVPHEAGSILVTLRSAMNLTQEEVADRSGITVRQIRNLEAGKVTHPRPHTLVALAQVLNLTPAERDLFVAHFHSHDHPLHPGPARATSVPRQLPPKAPDFTGRHEELELLRTHLRRADGVGAALVVGLGGIGKTSLAIEACVHELGGYSGGQLYARLVHQDGTPKNPSDVAVAFLRALGCDSSHLPSDQEELAALWRSTACNRQLLMLLDDAMSEDQVRQLLPGGPSSVIITSRSALGGLDVALRMRLQPLDETSSEVMFRRVSQVAAPQADSAAVSRLVRVCAGHPLALRLLATRVALRPKMSIASLADWVESDGHRLDSLASGDRTVAVTLSASLKLLDDISRRTLLRLAQARIGQISAWHVAAVGNLSLIKAEDMLETLLSGGLLEMGQSRGVVPHYRLHDLVREYLVINATTELPREAIVRLAAVAARLTAGVINPSVTRPVPHVLTTDVPESFDSVALPLAIGDATTWFDDEVEDLLAILGLACRAHESRAAGGLLAALRPALTRSGRLEMLSDAAAQCVTASADDRLAEGCALLASSSVDAELGRYRRAATSLEKALGQLGDADACTLGGAWYEFGWVQQHLGELDRAEAAYLHSVDLHQSIGNDFGELGCRLALAELYVSDERTESSYLQLERARELAGSIDDYRTQVKAMVGMARALRTQGHAGEVLDLLGQARALAATNDDELLVISCLCAQAAAERLIGDVDAAIRDAAEARDRAVALHRRVEEAVALTELGHAQLTAGLEVLAVASWRGAWELRVAMGHEEHCRDLETWMESALHPVKAVARQ